MKLSDVDQNNLHDVLIKELHNLLTKPFKRHWRFILRIINKLEAFLSLFVGHMHQLNLEGSRSKVKHIFDIHILNLTCRVQSTWEHEFSNG